MIGTTALGSGIIKVLFPQITPQRGITEDGSRGIANTLPVCNEGLPIVRVKRPCGRGIERSVSYRIAQRL